MKAIIYPKRKFLLFSFLIIFFTFLNAVCYSQADTIKSAVKDITATTATDTAEEPVSKPIRVIAIYNISHQANNANRPDDMYDSASIGDIIVVRVSNLDALLKRSKCQDSRGNTSDNCRTQKIRLFINGRMINSIEPISGAPDKDEGTLQYRLDRNTDNDKIWADILGAPQLFSDRFFVKPVKISVGLESEYAIETAQLSDYNFQLIRMHKGWFWSCFFGLILYLALMYISIKSYGLLRDRGIDLTRIGIANNDKNRPYSLGRFQMAFWFTMVIVSFLFIWLITDAYDVITPGVLALIGISAGTSLSSMVIDNSKSEEVLQQTISLYQEKEILTTEIAELKAPINAVPPSNGLSASQAVLNQKMQRVADITPLINKNILLLKPVSHSFLKDILSDVNGISFHRLQMFIWTIVLGLLFIYSVWKRLSMPEFSATLLALQGLTAGTYLGFKFPEKKA